MYGHKQKKSLVPTNCTCNDRLCGYIINRRKWRQFLLTIAHRCSFKSPQFVGKTFRILQMIATHENFPLTPEKFLSHATTLSLTRENFEDVERKTQKDKDVQIKRKSYGSCPKNNSLIMITSHLIHSACSKFVKKYIFFYCQTKSELSHATQIQALKHRKHPRKLSHLRWRSMCHLVSTRYANKYLLICLSATQMVKHYLHSIHDWRFVLRALM